MILDPNRTWLAVEIFDEANKIEELRERVNFLRSKDSKNLRILLKAAYNPKIEWVLPTGSVPFLAIEGPARTNLLRVAGDLYVFVKGGADGLNKIRREHLFIQMLESLSPKEAEILVFIKDKSLEELYPNLNKETIEMAFPTVLA